MLEELILDSEKGRSMEGILNKELELVIDVGRVDPEGPATFRVAVVSRTVYDASPLVRRQRTASRIWSSAAGRSRK